MARPKRKPLGGLHTKSKSSSLSVQPAVRVPAAMFDRKEAPTTRVPAATVPYPKAKPKAPILQLHTTPRGEQPSPSESDFKFIREYDVIDGSFSPKEPGGISAFRPEIISVSDLFPIYYKSASGKILNEVGYSLFAESQIEKIRRDTLSHLLQNIKEWDPNVFNQTWRNVYESLQDTRDNTRVIVSYLRQLAQAIESAKNQTNIKQISDSAFDLDNHRTLMNLLSTTMQFREDQAKLFSSTKIFLQLCHDLRSIAENYSFDLLDLTDQDRVNDNDPTSIDTTYTTRDNFRFSLDSLRSTDTPTNATVPSVFGGFERELPKFPQSRIKLLLATLSKEYRVSRGLFENRNVLHSLYEQPPFGSPFGQIIGNVGDNIFSIPTTNYQNSLVNLAQINIANNQKVFALEQKYIDDPETESAYVPGTSYFFDSMVDTEGGTFNTQPFVEYVNLLSANVSNAKTMIESLFVISKDDSSRLSPDNMFDLFCRSLASATSGLRGSSINSGQSIVYTVFEQSNYDTTLKRQLFQFLLLAGMYTTSFENRGSSDVFDRLGIELQTTDNMGEVARIQNKAISLVSGKSNLEPYLQNLAERIIDRVIQNTNRLREKKSDTSVTQRNPREVLVSSLMSSITTTRRTNSISSLVREFVTLANSFDSMASSGGSAVYTQENGTTRFNSLSTSTILLIIFEVLCSFVAKYPYSYGTGKRVSESGRGSVFFYHEVEPAKFNNFKLAIDRVVDNSTLSAGSLQVVNDLSEMRTKLANENKTLKDFLHVFDVFKQTFSAAQEMITRKFNSSTLESFVQSGGKTENLQIVKNPSQLRTSLFLFDEYKEKMEFLPEDSMEPDMTKYIVTETPTPEVLRTLQSLFQKPEYSEETSPEERVKIVTVGVPAGLSRRLYERLSTANLERRSFVENKQQIDVIKINVYKRDARFSNLVFKPKSYVFDLSLYASDNSFYAANPRENENYDNILQRIELRDYENINSFDARTLSTLAPVYSGVLTPEQQKRMFDNHVRSKLIEHYIYLMTSGTRITEDTFTVEDVNYGSTINTDFVSMFRQYMNQVYETDFGNQSLVDYLNGTSNDEEAKDLARIVAFGNPLVLEPRNTVKKISEQKLFDRVFHIPIRVDDFEVDTVLTNSTESGRLALLQSYTRDKIEITPDTKQAFESTGQDQIIFSDFFVTIEANL